LGVKNEDDGIFFIPFDDYLKQYAWTSIAVDEDPKYKRIRTNFQFHSEHAAYFMLDLKQDARLKELSLDFCIQVCQQGDRLGKYRKRTGAWEPARFSLALFNCETGELLSSNSSDRFSTSCIYESDVLKSGNYFCAVVPVWNESAEEDFKHKEIFMEVLSPVNVDVHQVPDGEGQLAFKHFLKKYA
jgi:hypothetical protein